MVGNIEKMKKKLKSLEEIREFQVEMGEDTTIVDGKIRELKTIINEQDSD